MGPSISSIPTSVLAVLLAPLPANALSALYDFDDFPRYTEALSDPGDPRYHEPLTFRYGCDGKDHCTHGDVNDLYAGDADTLSTTRNGISLTFSRPGGWDLWDPSDEDLSATTGNNPYNFDLFVADFSHELVFARMEITAPLDLDVYLEDAEAWLRVELWSDPGATGEIVSSLLLEPEEGPSTYEQIVVQLEAPGGKTFRSMRFGHDLYDPTSSCTMFCVDNSSSWDDLYVSTVPEPSTGALVGLGLLGLAARRRHQAALLQH